MASAFARGNLFQNGQQFITFLAFTFFATGCSICPKPGTLAPRKGDEIVVAGQFFHTGTPVVLWMDPGGYDAYRVERRFSPLDESDWAASHDVVPGLRSPNRFGLRKEHLTPNQLEQVRGGGWNLPLLQQTVDQFVIHFDAAGTSRQCFRTLHDVRCLSVHFMLDLDGTIYQTLDLKERAWHATIANSRSIGIEIANIGAYPTQSTNANALRDWYGYDAAGRTRITFPPRVGQSGIRATNFVGRPSRSMPVVGNVQGTELIQYDFTTEQYRSLIKLTASLCKIFPRLKCDYPRDQAGSVIPQKLSDEALERYHGILGHFHVQTDKVDPGPAFQWDHVVDGARELLGEPAFKR
jgi:N-acetyl-anhydromuramyl-L-alanine amidase AmpD